MTRLLPAPEPVEQTAGTPDAPGAQDGASIHAADADEGRVVLGSVFGVDDDDLPTGAEVYLRGRAAAGASGPLDVHVPARVEDVDGNVHPTGSLELDRPGVIIVHLDRALDAPVRLNLRGRGLLAPGGRRGDVLLEVLPDPHLVQERGMVRSPGTAWAIPAGLAGAALVTALVLLRHCVG